MSKHAAPQGLIQPIQPMEEPTPPQGRTLPSSKAQPQRELPQFYYHSHFLEMLTFVAQHYKHVLESSHLAFIEDFLALPFPAQCLYVRLANRKGRLFSRSRLRYKEINDIEAGIKALREADFLGTATEADLESLLDCMTRPQLLQALRPHLPFLKSSMQKGRIIDLARTRTTAANLFRWLPTDRNVVQGRVNEVRFISFLFFGNVRDGLTQFTMRDLGLVRAHNSDQPFEARFGDREDALHAFYFATRLHDLERNDRLGDLLSNEISDWPKPSSTFAADLRDQLAYTLGRCLEHDAPRALAAYQQGESSHCTERIVRVLLSAGERQKAQRHLERCIEAPSSDEEALLAADLYARKFGKKRTSVLTDQLRAAATIHLDEAYRGAPERAAQLWYRRQGAQAFRTENSLWRTLFGLLFWDLLFEDDASRLNSPFERLPAPLLERRFATEHASAISQRLTLFNNRKHLKHYLLRTSAAYFGKFNAVFRWRQETLDAMHVLIDHVDGDSLHALMTMLCNDYGGMRHGYPDLMIVDAQGLRFVEIKSDGDQLRRNQMVRMQQLQRVGLSAEVVRVQWTLDASQPYVVVDVETTGGRGPQHRVTEIGAVKVIDGKVIDHFETLLNPQRNIPANISQLTGINAAMVEDAPVFADIADDFARFLDGGIFVAHNVEFDYRFVKQEFDRIGRPFRMPKLCTCASMRKLYPGHRSYSLASLTQEYDIPLKSHHRALCDAQAAAKLLLRVNAKRLEQLTALSE